MRNTWSRYTIGTAGDAVAVMLDGRATVATRSERQPQARENVAALVAQANAAPELAAAARALLVALDSHFPGEPFLAGEVEALARALAKVPK